MDKKKMNMLSVTVKENRSNMKNEEGEREWGREKRRLGFNEIEVRRKVGLK